jgi:radical SAM protein with 4Fe4S-binding SPASM domain
MTEVTIDLFIRNFPIGDLNGLRLEKLTRRLLMAEDVYTFLSLLNNPVVRTIIKSASKTCPKCGETHLEVALDDYLGEGNGKPHCLTAKVVSKAVNRALSNGSQAFGITGEQLRRGLHDPYVRRGIANVLCGVATFGIDKPQTTGAPFLVVWNYTNACNLRCKHCYQNAGAPASDELPTAKRKEIVDELDREKVVSLAFSGGEPLIRPDFLDVARYAAKKGIYVSVATNGTMITKTTAIKLREAGIGYVEVSLDGANSEVHDTFRGVPGCFEKAIEGIRNLVDSGIYTCIAATVTKHNIHNIPAIVELGKKLKVKRVVVFNFIPAGRGSEIVNLDISPIEREHLLEYLYSELTKGEIQAFCTAPQFARVCMQKALETGQELAAPTHFAAYNLPGKTKYLTDFLGGCGAGRIYCAIEPNGLVTPCVFMPIVVGDLKTQSFKEIWLRSSVLADLRNRKKLKGRCSHCQHMYICGGCRARAYGYYRDYLAPDPGCIRELEESSEEFATKLEVTAV